MESMLTMPNGACVPTKEKLPEIRQAIIDKCLQGNEKILKVVGGGAERTFIVPPAGELLEFLHIEAIPDSRGYKVLAQLPERCPAEIGNVRHYTVGFVLSE